MKFSTFKLAKVESNLIFDDDEIKRSKVDDSLIEVKILTNWPHSVLECGKKSY